MAAVDHVSAKRFNKGGLAGPRRPGDPDPQAGLRTGRQLCEHFTRLCLMLLQSGLDQRDRLCQCPAILVADGGRQ